MALLHANVDEIHKSSWTLDSSLAYPVLSPSLTEVIHDLKKFYAFATIFAIKNLTLSKFLDKWDPWLKDPY